MSWTLRVCHLQRDHIIQTLVRPPIAHVHLYSLRNVLHSFLPVLVFVTPGGMTLLSLAMFPLHPCLAKMVTQYVHQLLLVLLQTMHT